MDIRFALIGLIIGFLIGMTGMGGGALMTPIMILVMGVKPIIAVGTDLAYGAVTKIVGGAAHLRHGTVHRKTAYLMALGSVPSTILGVGIVSWLRRIDPALVNVVMVRAIAVLVILVGLVLVAKPVIVKVAARRRRQAERTTDWRDDLYALGDRKPLLLPVLGAIVGCLVGLTSMGSGTLIIVSLLFLYPRWQSKEYVGTDVFHAALLVSASGLAHFVAGDVNVSMMLSLLIGSLPGVLVGSRLVVRIPEPAIRLSMATVLVASGSQLL